jgi:ankyrin repeat protein
LYAAAGAGQLEIVQLLLAAGAGVDGAAKSASPLYAAVGPGHRQVVQVLLAAGADVDAVGSYGRSPMHQAVFQDGPTNTCCLQEGCRVAVLAAALSDCDSVTVKVTVD